MNNRGITMLYVLMALVVVSFIGVGLINITTSDVKSSSYYGNSESARYAAQSGKVAGVTFLQSDRSSIDFDTLMDRINLFVNIEPGTQIPDSLLWLLGNDSTYLPIGGSGQGYRMKLEGVDQKAKIASIRIEAYGKGGSRSMCRSLFSLDGLELDTIWDTTDVSSYLPKAAFHMDGPANYELNGNVEIQGLTVLKGPLQINGTVTFNGDLYQHDGNYTSYFTGNSTFNGRTYFGGHVDASANPTFNGPVGFGGAIRSRPISIEGNVYHNGVVNPTWSSRAVESQLYNTVWDVTGSVYSRKSAYYNNGAVWGVSKEYLDEMCSYSGNVTRQEDSFDITTLMGFEGLPGSITFDTSMFDDVTNYYTGTNMTPTDMNNLYDEAVANGDTVCGGFMILRTGGPGVSPTEPVTKNGGGTFNGKALFIVDGNYDMPGFPKSSSSSNIVLYVKNRTTADDAEIKGVFRGVIYVDESKFTISPGNTETYGMVYYSANSHQDYHSGGITHIYDSTVLQELSCLNLFEDSESESSESERTLKDVQLILSPEFNHINTRLLSTSF